jgi:hypothetical protein
MSALIVRHSYLGRDIGNERIDDVYVSKNTKLGSGEIYIVHGAPNKANAIRFAKKLFKKGYKTGNYVYLKEVK